MRTPRTLDDFEQILAVDFEFVAKPGERPDVVCVAWRDLRTGKTHRRWRDELSSTPPYRTDGGVLFVCFVANAELGCHLALGWPLPRYVADLNPAFRCIANGRNVPAGRGLLGALAYFGLKSGGAARKAQMQERITQGWPFSEEERAKILLYCTSDVEALDLLLPKILADVPLPTVLHWGEFVAASAAMEFAGVPIDGAIFQQLADKQTWRAVRDALVPIIDARYGVFVQSKAGDWSFNLELFGQYLEREGIQWPRTATGTLSTSKKIFDAMCKAHPQLESLRQLRDARAKLRKIRLAVGSDLRNRTVLWPFKSKTGRSQPKASQWIYSPAVWLRHLIKPAPGRSLAYVDWSSMEFGIAAALSGDPLMLEFYRSGDPYLSFARSVAAAPPDATKRTHGLLRDRYKVGLLAAQYGIKADGLACRLGCTSFEAHDMLMQHRELFSVYWRWAEDWLAHVLDRGLAWTSFGWSCATGITEFNSRSMMNWPVQSTGADILRIAVIMAHRRRLGLRAPVHDALLLEADDERIDADVSTLQECMRRASRIVLSPTPEGTFELRTDATIVRYPERYTDPRGTEMWTNVLDLLAKLREQQQAIAQTGSGV
jgi:DNA polymerase-1